tara:strand:+ start:2456 stop:2938 length:483 start_codon:yes stop_codon:yes gene_type:complete
MAKINVSAVLKKLQNGLGLSTGREKTPTEVADKVLATFNTNPDPEIFTFYSLKSDSVGGSVYTTHSTKRTFLYYALISVTKDANALSVRTHLTAFIKGKAGLPILSIRYEPSTAGNHHTSLVFPHPIELEKGKLFSFENSDATGSIDAELILGLSEVEEI